MRPDFLNVQVGDVVAVNQPGQKPYLVQVLYVEGVARFSDPNFLRVHALLNRDACHGYDVVVRAGHYGSSKAH